MFCIQDPSYENSKYLHETLISECVGCTTGAGAYAFATKDGINLLLLDDNFKDFLETGTFTLVVGTDDITNEHSIVSLIELQKKYGSHLVVKAYVHKGKGSTFSEKIKPKSDYPLKTLYPRAFQTGQNHLIYYDFTTVE